MSIVYGKKPMHACSTNGVNLIWRCLPNCQIKITTNITMYTVDALQYCMCTMSYKITASNQSGHNTIVQHIAIHTYMYSYAHIATPVPYILYIYSKIVVKNIGSKTN